MLLNLFDIVLGKNGDAITPAIIKINTVAENNFRECKKVNTRIPQNNPIQLLRVNVFIITVKNITINNKYAH
jgi:hypothetical protein